MEAEIDMSGRVEETNRPTALALANDVSVCIAMQADEKRKAIQEIEQLKKKRERKIIHILMFSDLLFLLLQDHIENLDLVTIDPEYEGYEATIKNRRMAHCQKRGIIIHADQISFNRVGKKSPAHELALSVFRGNVAPDSEITAKELLDLWR